MRKYDYEQKMVVQNDIQFWFVIDRDWDIMFHRVDGPAVVYPNGTVRWILEGDQVHGFDAFHKRAQWTKDEIVEWKLKYGSPTSELFEF